MPDKTPKDFNQAAATWDDKPRRVQLAHDVAAGIAAQVPLHSRMKALEFGCGTGLVSLQLAGKLQQILGVDSASGMLNVLMEKARTSNVGNVSTLLVDSAAPQLPESQFDLIFSSMVFHHVEDTAGLLQKLTDALSPGGFLAVADLDEDGGRFHDEPQGVYHDGFDRQSLSGAMAECGLTVRSRATVHIVVKDRPTGEETFPVFLLVAQKPDPVL